jgi:hypothetical protein
MGIGREGMGNAVAWFGVFGAVLKVATAFGFWRRQRSKITADKNRLIINKSRIAISFRHALQKKEMLQLKQGTNLVISVQFRLFESFALFHGAYLCHTSAIKILPMCVSQREHNRTYYHLHDQSSDSSLLLQLTRTALLGGVDAASSPNGAPAIST